MRVKCRCGGIRPKKNAPCSKCGKGKRQKTTDRGYGYDHQKIRENEKKQLEFQLCVHCYRKGIRRVFDHLDHIVAFRGKHDPRRTDPYNRQPLCQDCHEAKTALERTGTYDPTEDLKTRRLALDTG